MKERPILFSGPMVRAILAGTKTVTRRTRGLEKINAEPDAWTFQGFDPRNGLYVFTNRVGFPLEVRCPYGRCGDGLWVRETWRPWCWREDIPLRIQFQSDGSKCEVGDVPEEWYERICVEATDECAKAGLPMDEEGCYTWGSGECPLKWRPSIFLPREASRLDLTLTADPMPERLQEITEEQAQKEGVEPQSLGGLEYGLAAAFNLQHQPYRSGFANLWNRINAERGHGWQRNEWVWPIPFRRVEARP